MLKIVGLGLEVGDLSLRGATAINNAECVVVKTAFMPTYEYVLKNNIAHTTLDAVYDDAQSFDDLNIKICDSLRELGADSADKTVVLCVGGNPIDDKAVEALVKQVDCEIIGAASYAQSALAKVSTLCKSTFVGYVACGCYDFLSGWYDWSRQVPLVITEIDNAFAAGDLKIALYSRLGEGAKVALVGEKVAVCAVEDLPLDGKFDYKSCVVCFPQDLTQQKRFGFADIIKIFGVLRGEGGCDWDKAQTHSSIRKNLIEEAYELIDAIENEDFENMAEECGDVMLQSIFHAKIAEDFGEFDIDEVLGKLGHKLVSRHTHIFGQTKSNSADEAKKAWDEAKAKEKKQTTLIDKMDDIACSLPALTRAEKCQKIASKCAFKEVAQINSLASTTEALKDVALAGEMLCKNDAKAEDLAKVLEIKGGDVLFGVVGLLNKYGISCELALSRAIASFRESFNVLERNISTGKPTLDTDKAALIAKYWEKK